MRYIFDLDHTVIDSSHRQLTRADGTLDLDHWRENCTREKIFGDSLLPLADRWRVIQGEKWAEILICTARVISQDDRDFLASHGLRYDALLSRAEGDQSGDAVLKARLLRDYAKSKGLSFARFARLSIMIDDNKSVLNHLQGLGFQCYNAIKLNAQLKAAK